MRRFVSGLILAVLVACTESTGPTTSLAGNWSGTISSVLYGNGAMAFTLAQSSKALSGTWSATFANAANNDSGSLSGNVSGSAVSIVLTPSNPFTCPFNVTATLSGSTSMSGTYAAFNCTVAASGTFVAAKQ